MVAGSSRAAALRTRAPTLLLLAFALVACAWGLGRALAWRVGLEPVLGRLLWLDLAGLVAALASTLAAVALELRDVLGRTPRSRALAPVLKLLVVAVLAWLGFLLALQPFQRLWFDMALAGVAETWALLLVLERAPRQPASRARRMAGLAWVSLCAAVVLLELGLRAVAAVRPLPILARADDGPRRFVERFRCRPGEVRFGFPCNERGYYDEPLAPRRAGEDLVVAIGDSFNLGSVPHAWHFTTVCEQLLGVPVLNVGVAGIGPPEYHHLLVEEALPLERDRPQQLVGAWLARQGIPCLDLLPHLRAVPPLEDGRRHLYHLRDTHFNARGNAVAGEALAAFLEELLSR